MYPVIRPWEYIILYICRGGNIVGFWCEKACSYCPLLHHPIDPFFYGTLTLVIFTGDSITKIAWKWPQCVKVTSILMVKIEALLFLWLWVDVLFFVWINLLWRASAINLYVQAKHMFKLYAYHTRRCILMYLKHILHIDIWFILICAYI